MTRLTAAAVLLLLFLLFGPSGPGLAQAPDTLQLAVDTSGHPQLTLTATVPPELAGADVPAEAFALAENGGRVPIDVTPLPDDKLEVLLVIDTSGSMRGSAIEAAKTAATAFLAKMPPTTRIGVIGFGPSPVLASPLSLDRGALSAAVAQLEARGETALYDAVALAVAQFSPDPSVRRSIVLLSDGGDTASRETLEGAAGKIEAAGIRLDVAELLSTESNRVALQQLATSGKGTVAAAADPVGLDAIYDNLARSLANQYRLSFRSASSGRTELRLTVDHAGVHAEGTVVVDLPVVAPATSAPTPAPAPQATPAGDVALWALLVGALCFFLAMTVLWLMALLPSERRAAISRLGRANLPSVKGSRVSGLATRATEMAEHFLNRRGRWTTLNGALERAGIAMRPGEFVVLALSVGAIGLMLGLVLSGPLLGLMFAVLVALGFRAGLSVLASRRQERFAEQLTGTLQLMAGSLRSGYALAQAFDVVAREGESPTRDEFRRLVVESRLGRELQESLAAMAERVRSDDFAWVVGAIEINREVGGDLAEVLDNVANTIRERNQLRRQVRTLSAEGRLSMYVLMALPVFMTGVMFMANRSYLLELRTGFGPFLCLMGLVLMVVGGVWMKKICRVVF